MVVDCRFESGEREAQKMTDDELPRRCGAAREDDGEVMKAPSHGRRRRAQQVEERFVVVNLASFISQVVIFLS